MKEHIMEYNLEDLDIEITGSMVPYDAGKTWGPIEDCYPPEGGYAEDVGVFLTRKDEDGKEIRLDITDFLPDAEINRLSGLLYEDMCERSSEDE